MLINFEFRLNYLVSPEMRAYIPRAAWGMPEAPYMKALKAEAEVVEGGLDGLLLDLALYRYTIQKIIDVLWIAGTTLDRKSAHKQFYKVIRSYGFRAHVARNMYKTAVALVKSARSSGGSKPELEKLSARLDMQDARVDLEAGLVRIALRNDWYTLRLKHRAGYIERFRGLQWREVHIKYENGRLYMSIIFRVWYRPYKPKGFIALDINLRHIVAFDGSNVWRYETRFYEALALKARAEELQRRYPRMWRFSRRIYTRFKLLHKKAKSIIVDWSWKLAKEIILKARKLGYGIALESLDGLLKAVRRMGWKARWKLAKFTYRRLVKAIICKALEWNVPIIIVNPRGTSTTCPKCKSKLSYEHRLAICRKCGYKRERDTVGAINTWIRAVNKAVKVYTRMRGSLGLPKAPPQ